MGLVVGERVLLSPVEMARRGLWNFLTEYLKIFKIIILNTDRTLVAPGCAPEVPWRIEPILTAASMQASLRGGTVAFG
jgi:hypothetical protein